MLPILANYSTVIALISKMKNTSKKMFRLSFGGCNEEIIAQVQKGSEDNMYLLLYYSKMFS